MKKVFSPFYDLIAFLAVLAACIATIEADDTLDDYDDAQRFACVQSINSFFQDHTKEDDAYSSYLDSSKDVQLARNRTWSVWKTSYPEEALESYRHSCQEIGALFSSFTGAFDCWTKYNLTEIKIHENQGICFPPSNECNPYSADPHGALEWQLDIYRLFDNDCHIIADSIDKPVNNIQSSVLSQSRTPMPVGEPVFRKSTRNDRKYRKCMDALGQSLGLFDDDDTDSALYDEHFHHLSLLHLETIQEEPIITQREWYPDDDPNRMKTFQQLCENANRRFETFSGVMDCLHSENGESTVTVIENAAICFPETGCEGYSHAQWKEDSWTFNGVLSCHVRDRDTKTENTVSETQSPSTALIEDKENDYGNDNAWNVRFIVSAAVLFAFIAVLSIHQRKMNLKNHLYMETRTTGLELSSNFQDHENENENENFGTSGSNDGII